jgi:hypothetical protein
MADYHYDIKLTKRQVRELVQCIDICLLRRAGHEHLTRQEQHLEERARLALRSQLASAIGEGDTWPGSNLKQGYRWFVWW